ncbi:DUF4407 domain-containing protein [Microbacterium sp. SORGH_AS_0888]|uniref:DUF4407 domain-containing protein n=1 Tax=Microbacterium sp. SORGH_AS_0888 TaxID=3041791 RepID=UPI0027880F69|nr:DUF4407 domain-containing protein [Microbacterium sp. SORGH_AS_0888]MDQ1129522.1 hypothetical protein [Microbacterium sp. SORGH_AS_0888]
MSFSAHRPGRFGSDGRIELSSETPEDEPMYLSDVRAQQGESPDAATLPIDETTPAEPVETTTPEQTASEEPEPVAQRPTTRVPRERRGRRLPLWRRLAVLGGADNEILDDVPSETSRFVQMFFVLAGTALVSALSMTFALITGVRISIWLAVPLAIVWALIIFNLDRFLTSTMRSTRNLWRLLGLALPRVIMAALIGIVVAEPLVLQVFHNDIAREVTSTNVVQAQTDQDAVANGPEKQALDAASASLAALQNQAATGIVAGTSSTSAESVAAQATVDQLTTQLADQQKVIDQARALYQCELTGEGAGTVPGCTGLQGEGASADAAKAQLAQAQSAYDALANQLTQAQATLAAANGASTEAAATSAEQNKKQAQDQLPAAQAQYDAALAAYNDRAAAVAGGNADAVGLLSQIGALERLSEREPTLAWAHWLIAALFFMIELLPVLVKVLTSYGDPSLYEKAETMRKQVALDRVTAKTWRERAAIVTAPPSATSP